MTKCRTLHLCDKMPYDQLSDDGYEKTDCYRVALFKVWTFPKKINKDGRRAFWVHSLNPRLTGCKIIAMAYVTALS